MYVVVIHSQFVSFLVTHPVICNLILVISHDHTLGGRGDSTLHVIPTCDDYKGL